MFPLFWKKADDLKKPLKNCCKFDYDEVWDSSSLNISKFWHFRSRHLAISLQSSTKPTIQLILKRAIKSRPPHSPLEHLKQIRIDSKIDDKRQITCSCSSYKQARILFRVFTHDKLLLIVLLCAAFAISQPHSTRNDIKSLLELLFILFSIARHFFSISCACAPGLIVNITWDYYQMPQIFIRGFRFTSQKQVPATRWTERKVTNGKWENFEVARIIARRNNGARCFHW